MLLEDYVSNFTIFTILFDFIIKYLINPLNNPTARLDVRVYS